MRSVLGALVVLLSACGGDAPTATSPSPALGARLPGGATAGTTVGGDSLSRWLANTPGTCLVGTRTADGRYPSRTVTMSWPARFTSIGGQTARLAYRGWQAGLPEPAILAVCTIADVPGAREFLSGRLGGRAMDAKELRTFAKAAGATKTEEWGGGLGPQVMQGAAPVFMIDGLASKFPTLRTARFSVSALPGGGDVGIMMTCDQVDDGSTDCDPPTDPPPPPPPPPTCDPYVDQPQPGCEETVPTIPPEPALPSVIPVPSGVPEICWGETESVHLSTSTVGFGRLSVHANTECPDAWPQRVTVTLHRERCFLWVFCGYPQLGNPGTYANTARLVDAKTNYDCMWSEGWYLGHGYHQVNFPSGGVGYAESESYYITYLTCQT